jgi:hypothetical protein
MHINLTLIVKQGIVLFKMNERCFKTKRGNYLHTLSLNILYKWCNTSITWPVFLASSPVSYIQLVTLS